MSENTENIPQGSSTGEPSIPSFVSIPTVTMKNGAAHLVFKNNGKGEEVVVEADQYLKDFKNLIEEHFPNAKF